MITFLSFVDGFPPFKSSDYVETFSVSDVNQPLLETVVLRTMELATPLCLA